MAAFLVAGIGKARKLEGAIDAFKSVYRLNRTTWIIRKEVSVTAREVVEALGLRENGVDAVIVRLDATNCHGVADPAIWRFVDGGLKTPGERETRKSSSVYNR